jgi:peroxiredoxin
VLASARPALAAPHEGDPAPPFSLASARGGTVASARFAGKPLYLNFFASWCGPCNEEAPDVSRLYRTYHRRGLAMIGVDELEDTKKAVAFAHQYGWSFPLAEDADGNVGRDYGAVGLPVHVFIDKHGQVSTYRLGDMSASEIEDAIKKIL